MVGFYINTIKMTFFSFDFLQSFLSLQVIKHLKNLLNDSYSLFPCLCVSMLFENLLEIEIEI